MIQPGPYLIQRLDHGFAVGPALPGGEPGEVDPRFVCQDEDDARAAQALPDLLAALQAAMPYVDRVAGSCPTQPANKLRQLEARKVRDLARAAIAKAEGRGE